MGKLNDRVPIPSHMWNQGHADSWNKKRDDLITVLSRSEKANKGYAAHGMDKLEHKARCLLEEINSENPKDWTFNQLSRMHSITLELSGYLYKLKYL